MHGNIKLSRAKISAIFGLATDATGIEMRRIFQRWVVRPFEILLKTPLRFLLGRIFPSKSPRVFFGYERIPARDEPASGGIVKLQDLAEIFPNCRWRANTLYLISSCYPWTVRWQVRVARFFGARIVLNQNGVAYPAWKSEGWEEENARAGWVHDRADVVIYQSEFCKRCALEWLKVVEPRESWVLLNPVDLEMFSPSENVASAAAPMKADGRENWNQSSESPSTWQPMLRNQSYRILLAGSHQFAYRVRGALDALHQLDERFVMTVAGAYNWRNSQEEALKEAKGWAESLGVHERVEFRGRYLQQEAPFLLQESVVLLHTKVMDPCPRLVAEALASGLPVVYAASGGLPEMVAEDAGIGVPSEENFQKESPADSAAFADAIQRVCANLENFREGARRCAEERFDRGPWIEAHGQVFSQRKMANVKHPTSNAKH